MTPAHLGLDAGPQERPDLEHLLARAAELCAAAGHEVVLASTHLVDGERRHWAGALELTGARPGRPLLDQLAGGLGAALAAGGLTAGPPAWVAGAEQAAGQLAERSAGRVVRFAGQDALVGVLPAEDVVRLSAVDRLLGVAGTPTTGVRLDTRGFVRPELVDGELVLRVRPFREDGLVAPFETEHPTPCCVDHAPRAAVH